MPACPNFECLDFSASKCEKYPACDGCSKLYDCDSCNNQASVVEGKSLPCEMIHLPNPCRFCQARQTPSFSPAEHCLPCAVRRSKADGTSN